MSTEVIITSILVFLAIVCIGWAFTGFMPTAVKNDNPSKIPALFRIFSGGISFFSREAGKMLEEMFPKYSKLMSETLAKADVSLEVQDIYGAQLFFGLSGAAGGALIAFSTPMSLPLQVFCMAVLGVIGLFYPWMYIQKIAEKRADEILHHLPFAIDLISSSMNAGLDFGASVRYLIASGENDVLRKEFAIFLREIELGKTRTDALRDMQNRVSITEFTRFASAIAYGMDSGSSIINIMRIQAEEMRRVKYARAEQQAAKAPTKMIVPMALFIFPSMFIIIFTPIFLRLKESGILSMVGK